MEAGSSTTLEPWAARHIIASWKVPSLTVLYHPDVARIGDVARLLDVLDGQSCRVSRLEPRFSAADGEGGAPLGDRHLSRAPLVIARADEGGVTLSPPSRLPVVADGKRLTGPQSFARSQLERGIILELADRVVLLLHLLGPLAPRQPRLGLVGDSEALEHVRAEIVRMADLQVPVLLQGESGTGKELAARAIARTGPRAQSLFVAVNMAAIPASMAASELFGHTVGAFTGATHTRAGLFTQADGGTLFLDEVGEMPIDVQAMLLRVLETQELRPLGSERPVRVDVRVLAATDADLAAAVQEGTFREALLHRLGGYSIELPPLRARRDDIGRLFRHFLVQELEAIGEQRRLDQLSRSDPWLPASVVAVLGRYDWPGNVRQLGNVVRRLVVAGREGRRVGLEALPSRLLEASPADASTTASTVSTVSAATSEASGATDSTPPAPLEARARASTPNIPEDELLAALRANDWRTAATARSLGISRTTLYALIDKSSRIRKAKDVPADELRRCFDECGGEVEATAAKLEVSARGIKLRLRELGIA